MADSPERSAFEAKRDALIAAALKVADAVPIDELGPIHDIKWAADDYRRALTTQEDTDDA